MVNLKFVCRYCDSPPFPHFKALLDHYRKHHSYLMKRYEIKNKGVGKALVYAPTEDEAAYASGWPKFKCTIRDTPL